MNKSRNRFNMISSKEWLPFQKSWFIHSDDTAMFRSNVRFFTKSDEGINNVFVDGLTKSKSDLVMNEESINKVSLTSKNISFAYLDLRKDLEKIQNETGYKDLVNNMVEKLNKIFDKLDQRRFVCLVVKNMTFNGTYLPFAWDIGKISGSIFSLKDEKIGCISAKNKKNVQGSRLNGYENFYCIYLRKDENSPKFKGLEVAKSNINWNNHITDELELPSWFILKPPPRKKDEILHPAKYPEELVDLFVNTITSENSNIYDPMSGTGSTQVGAIRNNRNGYGMELSPFFAEIALNRCQSLINPAQESLFESKIDSKFTIINDDSRNFRKYKFPMIDYLFTSPPYWDMLNMKGAENQAKRIEKGLQTNYSEDTLDLGNISDYDTFIRSLCSIYFEHVEILNKGSYMTIVVKNIKKKGSNYPFAWDLAFLLQEKFELLPENFWLQDDISIAPFGYGYTWVSNTFHQYCLNFRLRAS